MACEKFRMAWCNGSDVKNAARAMMSNVRQLHPRKSRLVSSTLCRLLILSESESIFAGKDPQFIGSREIFRLQNQPARCSKPKQPTENSTDSAAGEGHETG